jgi:Family of unknown function (DUF6788)
MRDLLDRRRRALRALPSLEEIVRGSIVERQIRCGKPGCRCARGRLHGATYLSVTFAGGRTEQISLPAGLVPIARRWVANYQAWWKAVEKISAINRQLLRARRLSAPKRSGRAGKAPP